MEQNNSEEIVEEAIIDDNPELAGEESQEDEQQEETTEESEQEEKPAEEPEVNPLEKKIEKMQHGFEKRIGKVTAKYRSLEDENAQLKAMIEQQSKPVEAPKGRNDFDSDEEWVSYVADQRAEAILEKRNQAQQRQLAEQQKSQSIAEEWSKKVEAVTDILPDYEEVINSVDEDVILPQEAAQVVLESDVGAQLAYHLAKNPNDVIKMQSMSPRQIDRFLARLEYKVENEYSKPKSANVTKATAPTPKPQGNSASAGKSNSIEDWMARRNKRRYGN